MGDGEFMVKVRELEQRIERLEADDWHKAGASKRGLFVFGYQLLVLFWVWVVVIGIGAVLWILGLYQ